MTVSLPAMTGDADAASTRAAAHALSPRRRSAGAWGDRLFSALAQAAAWLTLLLLGAILVSLLIGAAPAIEHFGLDFLWSAEWDPVQLRFGGLAMIYGTLMTSLIALLLWVYYSAQIFFLGAEFTRQYALRHDKPGGMSAQES